MILQKAHGSKRGKEEVKGWGNPRNEIMKWAGTTGMSANKAQKR